MTRRRDTIQSVSRRSALKLIGVGGGIVLGTGTVAGSDHHDDPKPHPHEIQWGDAAEYGTGEVKTYTTTNRAGNLSSLGVHVDGDALAAFDEEAAHFHLGIPEGDTHQFEFVGFDYGPGGHPPAEIYGVPHFDIHFYMMEEAAVEAIGGGPLGQTPLPFLGVADYDIPDDQFPAGYGYEEVRFIVQAMGEHLLDTTAPEFHGEQFTHTYVYGAYDPTIDPEHEDGMVELPLGPAGEDVAVPVYGSGSTGRLTFIEPMITTEFLRTELDAEVPVEVSTPEVFYEAGDYPTTYVMKPDGSGGVYVSIDGFEAFPGSTD